MVAVEKAIHESDLGLNPQADGELIRIPIPELNEERRMELKKMIKSMGEKCKISIRNIRRDANEELKKLLKSKEIGEDEEKSFEKNVQTITDKHISIVDEKISSKLREHWDDGEIVEMLGVISLFGFLNRWNDSMGTPIEERALESGTHNAMLNKIYFLKSFSR